MDTNKQSIRLFKTMKQYKNDFKSFYGFISIKGKMEKKDENKTQTRNELFTDTYSTQKKFSKTMIKPD